MKKYILIFAAAMALFTACNRLDIPGMFINRSDTEERVNDWLTYNELHGEPVIVNAPDDYTFYVSADTHYALQDSIVAQGEKDRIYHFVTKERNDSTACFSTILGDLAGEAGEAPYLMVKKSLAYNADTQQDEDPCFCIVGNHDTYFDCAKWYKEHFHTSTYSLTVNTLGGHKDLYLFLDSGNGTHGKRQLDWLKDKLSHRNEYRHCFVLSHCWIFRTYYNYTMTPQANLPLEEQYDFMALMSENNVSLVVLAHSHENEHREVLGIQYVEIKNLNTEGTPCYLRISCGDKVAYELLLSAKP
ncbi:MAG: metallophosphoesterase [Bacteroidales bacterium]|nr:metallophosphoesterase [Bacteroidales bacterium]